MLAELRHARRGLSVWLTNFLSIFLGKEAALQHSTGATWLSTAHIA